MPPYFAVGKNNKNHSKCLGKIKNVMSNNSPWKIRVLKYLHVCKTESQLYAWQQIYVLQTWKKKQSAEYLSLLLIKYSEPQLIGHHTFNFSHTFTTILYRVCPASNMASETVKRSIAPRVTGWKLQLSHIHWHIGDSVDRIWSEL